MLNLGAGEIILILVAALLILGPKRLPEMARGLGKFFREFRRQTDEVRTVVEREFYRMDQELDAPPTPSAPASAHDDQGRLLPPPGVTASIGMPLPTEPARPPDPEPQPEPQPEPAASAPDAPSPAPTPEPRQG
jgi:sec-independent protein translocase protein TatB